MSRLISIVRRDLYLALRQGMDSTMVVTFFILAVELFPLGVWAELAVPQIRNHLFGIRLGVVEVGALVFGGQESGAPQFAAPRGRAKGDESRQIFVFRAQAIGYPGSQRGSAAKD